MAELLELGVAQEGIGEELRLDFVRGLGALLFLLSEFKLDLF